MSDGKHKRGRPSSIDKLPEDIRVWLNSQLRDPGRTQTDILADLNCRLLAERLPEVSKSALNRHAVYVSAHGEKIAQLRSASEVLVDRFGDDPDNMTGRALVSVCESLIWNFMSSPERDDMSAQELQKLAGSIRALTQAGKQDAERAAIAQRFSAQQAVDAVADAAKAGGLSKDMTGQLFEAMGVPRRNEKT